ncbi:MAG TPA: GMC family oxidoreductase [Verrucomicrobiae bacterium]|jgi:cholesterol oxidase
MRENGEHFDAVVVGSGFGGAINALRLAQAGKSVLVLERGKRYRPADFPRDVTDVDRLFWRYPHRPAAQGLYDVRFFSGLAAVAASGVGGGSLIYANIHIRPDSVVFKDPRWPRTINRTALDPYYDRVAQTLGVAPLPTVADLPKRNAFQAVAQRMGREVFDPDQAVSWSDPEEPGREACSFCAECEFGCTHGAKNTLDFTYLAQAERLGVRVEPGINVSHVEPASDGYRVHYHDLANGSASSVTGARVVLSAGTLGTNEILLRSRDKRRTLPKLSARLGYGFSGNGDFLGNVQEGTHDLRPWHGTDVTSVMRFFDAAPEFTLAAPTFNRATMEVLAAQGQPKLDWLRPLAPLLWPLMGCLVPWAFGRGLLSQPSRRPARNVADPARMTNLFAIGRDNANGRLRLKGERLDIEWDYAGENEALIDRMLAAMREVGAAYGGNFAPLLTWSLFKRITTVHPLGGCRLSESPETGVVSPRGEVHGYPDLFVADGSVIPAAIGFHPAMTISAVAESIAETVVRSF